MCAGHIACEGVCAFSLVFFFFEIFFCIFFFLLLRYSGYVHTKTQKGTQKPHKSNIKWMGIVHVSVSGCGPNQYASSWSVCESVSMCAGHIACEGVCAFSLWFFFFLKFFLKFFFLLLRYSGYVHTKTQKGTQKKHKSNIKWMGIVHVCVSGCGPNQYVSSWLVGWLVGWSVGQSVGRQSSSWSVGQSSSQLVGRSVGRSVGQSVGRQSSSQSVGRQSSSWSVGRSVSWSSIVKSVGWSYV